MIKFILPKEVLPLRSLVLRNGKPFDECIFPSDEVENAFHLGFFVENELISIASFLPSDQFEEEGNGYQLRGMATNPAFSGKGYGTALIGYAADYLKSIKVNYIWCNARSSAATFYKNMGFKSETPEFDIPGIGFHYEMILILNKKL